MPQRIMREWRRKMLAMLRLRLTTIFPQISAERTAMILAN